jgi:hypothetical protein
MFMIIIFYAQAQKKCICGKYVEYDSIIFHADR